MKIQCTYNSELLEIFPIDKWSRDHSTRLLGIHQIGYVFTPTTMTEYSLRFNNQADYELARQLIQEHEITD